MELVQTAFGEGQLAEEATLQAVVLLPNIKKGLPWYWPRGGDVEGSMAILNLRLTA